MNNYNPPFEITNEMLSRVSTITEKLAKFDCENLDKRSYLRKQTKINSIHSSLAIENNELTVEQVKDVIDGKLVYGSKKDIQEVKNAYSAYDLLKDVDPYSLEDLKKVHGIITYLTVDESGIFRSGNEGVFDGNNCIFVAPPPERVPILMDDLFKWMEKSKKELHPLILSSIFHYEFVFIHPFQDGNGRMARLWQNILLYNWKEIFEYLPIESKIYKYQSDYYAAINNCNNKGSATEFIEFMLKMIDETIDGTLTISSKLITQEDFNITKILEVMEQGKAYSASELMNKLNIKTKITLRNSYLNPAINQGLIKQTIPDKPQSSKQKYYKI